MEPLIATRQCLLALFCLTGPLAAQAAGASDKPNIVPMMPHTPHTPPERILTSYRDKGLSDSQAKYDAMCEWFDETCGQLLAHLDENGLSDNPLVVYVADNGWVQLADGNGYAPHSKRIPYEGGTRTPIMFRWPNVMPPAARPELCSSIDIVPTILSAAGAKVPGNLDGLDLLPAIRDGKSLGRDPMFGEFFAHDIADIEKPEASLLYRWVIEDQWKLLLTYDGAQGRMKCPPIGFAPQLYDLKNDPHEKNNLAGDHAELVTRLAKRVADWWPVTEQQARSVIRSRGEGGLSMGKGLQDVLTLRGGIPKATTAKTILPAAPDRQLQPWAQPGRASHDRATRDELTSSPRF